MSERAIKRRSLREQRRRARRSRAIGATVSAGAAIAIAAPGAQAASFEVTTLADAGAGSLRDAIAQANAAAGADTITFHSSLSGTIDVGSELQSTGELSIEGPGPGALTLDGGDATRILRSDSPVGLAVSGLTFTNGNSGGAFYSGGAIAAYGAALTIDDVVVTNSSAWSGGGAFLQGNDLEISDSSFSGNYASYSGGAVRSFGTGAADPATQEISISGSTITGNESVASGGGLAFYYNKVSATVDSSTISGNAATGGSPSAASGGGIWFANTHDGNAATVSSSTVSGNSALDAGGGVSFGEDFYGPTAVVNSTVTGNSAANGGGVQFADLDTSYVADAGFALGNSTVTGNEATVAGGGVWLGDMLSRYGATGGDLEISSSIVATNASPTAPDLGKNPEARGATRVGNSLLGNPAGASFSEDPAGTVLTGVDPELGPLQDNGGPTKTMLPAASSPVIDAGLANGLSNDQRRRDRTVQYPGVPKTLGSDGTDIGAVERAAPPDTVITSGPAAGATITTDSASFGFAGDPAAETAKLQCKLDSEPFTDCTSPKTFTGLSNGSHTVAFRAVNAAGEADPSPATRSFNVDATTPVPPDPPVPPVAPDTVITAGPIEGKTISRNRARFRFAGDPAATTAKLQCSLDREAFADCASPQTFDALGEGSHTVAFRAVDADGNADPTPATRRFIVDTAVADPFLRMKNPQLQGNKKVKLRVKAGAGEDVTAIASGRIRLGHGNAVKLRSEAVVAGGRVQLVLKPRPGFGGNRRIKKALREGRKAKAEIDARIKDVAGNKYYKLLEAKLKLRNRG